MSLTVLPPVDQVTDLVAKARERGTVAMADLTAAFDRCDLPADAVDRVLRLLADEGVEILKATLSSVASWEQEFKKPVVTTNQASIWAMLRSFNAADRLPAFGRLLAEVPADEGLDIAPREAQRRDPCGERIDDRRVERGRRRGRAASRVGMGAVGPVALGHREQELLRQRVPRRRAEREAESPLGTKLPQWPVPCTSTCCRRSSVRHIVAVC